MNCFYHPTITAVGICKSCGKGLCPECAVDLGKGLACKSRCEEDAKSYIRTVEYSNAMVDPKRGALGRGTLISGFLFTFIGGIFVYAGIQPLLEKTGGSITDSIIPLGFGAGVFCFGIWNLSRYRRITGKKL